MSRTVEIERKIERYKGNQMILNRLKQGAYQLRTGEADVNKKRESMYTDRFGNEIDEFIDRIDKDEELELSGAEKRINARKLKDQLDEGKKNLTLRFHGRDEFKR